MNFKNIDYKKMYLTIQKRYIISATLLLLAFISRQVIIQYQISQNEESAKIINIAGRQRMLSQKITKDVLILENSDDKWKSSYQDDLKTSLREWTEAQNSLLYGNILKGISGKNSNKIMMMYGELQDSYQAMVTATDHIIRMIETDTGDASELHEYIQVIRDNEEHYLQHMEEIVNQYDMEASTRINLVENLEIFLFIVVLVMTALITVMVFKPARHSLQMAFLETTENSKNFAKILSTVYGAIFVINESGEILLMNTDGEKLINNEQGDKTYYLQNEIKLLTIDYEKLLKQVKANQKMDRIEVEVEDNKGNKLYVMLNAAVVEYKYESVYMIGMYDVTDRKLEEEIIRNIAVTDKLTGLNNRHFLDTIIDDQIDRAERYEIPMSVFIFDLDHFKKINDRWGHPVGDSVLKHTAEIVKSNIRSCDYLIRIGGEEFIVILPHTGLQGAAIAAEKVRMAIENSMHPTVGKYTASFGVAERRRGETYRTLYKRIDDALYTAKSSGRNCVVQSKDSEEEYPSVELRWKNAWNCGEERIDEQHRRLFAKAVDMSSSTYSNEEFNEELQRLEELLKDVKEHFEYEEKILEGLEYDDYVKHRNIHHSLFEKGVRLKETLQKNELSLSTIRTFLQDDVIIGHILMEDVKFFSHIRKSA